MKKCCENWTGYSLAREEKHQGRTRGRSSKAARQQNSKAAEQQSSKAAEQQGREGFFAGHNPWESGYLKVVVWLRHETGRRCGAVPLTLLDALLCQAYPSYAYCHDNPAAYSCASPLNNPLAAFRGAGSTAGALFFPALGEEEPPVLLTSKGNESGKYADTRVTAGATYIYSMVAEYANGRKEVVNDGFLVRP